MRDRPAGLREHDLRLVLAEGWRIDAAALRYAPCTSSGPLTAAPRTPSMRGSP
ncbi:MAG: hypothetical protein ACRDOA_22415 [Streptosporangiaceae bacterium]